MKTFHNPVLRGFHPDPSCCRKGNDYYLVTSTFEYFPAVPVFHSTDLVTWKQIGHCVSDPSYLDLNGCPAGKGIYAPTIRYREADDMFYMVTTLCQNDNYYDNINFYVRAKDPAGPWSKPIVVKGARGIDPTLVFDKEKCYYLGNRRFEPARSNDSRRKIWIAELDIETGELIGEKRILLEDGAVHGARCPEGPHIYHFNDYYYLLISEGGTTHNHALSVFRSRDILGPYEINPRNPILTHRMMARGSEFNSIGHADILQAPDGSFWGFCLGVRPYGEPMLRNLGRESFVFPIIWEDDWPVFCPETGRVEKEYPLPYDDGKIRSIESTFTDFSSPELENWWQLLRTPERKIYELTDNGLRLFINQYTLSDNYASAFLGIRQREKYFIAETAFEFSPASENENAGMIVLLNGQNNYSLMKSTRNGQEKLILRFADEILYEEPCPAGVLRVRLSASTLDYWYEIKENGKWRGFGPVLDGHRLSKLQYGFTGVLIGLFGTSYGKESSSSALYRYFSYTDREEL
ncbi:MAG: glycoside hydrolase family 43 protein [Spirochaetales bacterium]|nr:glycoside hydrolase family 43 protein [Spirochaetales bacterium]